MPSRIAIISDVHANTLALRSVLKDARTQEVQHYWMLGDAVGYGYDPLNTLNMLNELPIDPGVWLAGNHDWGMVSLAYPQQGITMSAAQWGDAYTSIKQQYSALLQPLESTHGYLKHLSQLPYTAHPRPGIFVAHGAYYPGDPLKSIKEIYTNTASKIAQVAHDNATEWESHVQLGKPLLIFLGHSHHPMHFWRDAPPNTPWQQVEVYPCIPYTVDKPGIWYFNVGSVGFPRYDRIPCPTYIVLTELGGGTYEVTYRMVRYDTELARHQMATNGVLPSIYNDRLLNCSATTK